MTDRHVTQPVLTLGAQRLRRGRVSSLGLESGLLELGGLGIKAFW